MNVKLQLGKSIITDQTKNTIFPPTEEIPLIENTGVYQNGVYTGWKTKKADHSTGNEYPEIIDDDNIFTVDSETLKVNGENLCYFSPPTDEKENPYFGIDKVFFQKEVIDVMGFSGDEKDLHYQLEKKVEGYIFRKKSETIDEWKRWHFPVQSGGVTEHVIRIFFPKTKIAVNFFFVITNEGLYKVFIENLIHSPDNWIFSPPIKICGKNKETGIALELLGRKEAEIVYDQEINEDYAFVISSVVIPCDGINGIYTKLLPYKDQINLYLIRDVLKKVKTGREDDLYPWGGGSTESITYGVYFSPEHEAIYMAEIFSDNKIAPAQLMISAIKEIKGEAVESEEKIVEFGFCFSEFEFLADDIWICRSSDKNFSTRIDCILTETELIGYKDGFYYHTINGIPRVIEMINHRREFGAMVGGYTGEVVGVCGYNFFYQEDWRCFYFKKRSEKSDSLQLIKKGWIKSDIDLNHNLFSADGGVGYSSLAFTGAITCPAEFGNVSDEKGEVAVVCGYNGALSSSIHLPKVIRCSKDLFSPQSKVKMKLPYVYSSAMWSIPDVFDFYASDFGETQSMTYRYTFGESFYAGYVKKTEQNKIGSVFIENTYNRLIPIPIWASKIKNGVASGGENQFLLATDPKTRGKNPSIFLNYFIDSSFDDVQACFSITGNKYVQSENTIFGVEVDPQGAIIKATPYSDRVKMRYIGKSVDSAFFVSDFNNKIYRYTGFWEISPFLSFSNRKQIDSAYILDSHGVFILDSRKEKKAICIYDGNIFEIEKEGELFGSIQSNGKALFVKTKNEERTSFLKEYNLLYNQELDSHKQESFSVQTGYIGFNYNLILVRNISLLFYCKNYIGDVEITYKSNLPDVDIPPQKEVYKITQEDLLLDYEENQYFRINLKPRSQRVQSFSVQVSIPSIEQPASLSNIGLFSITADIQEGEKILLSENLSK